MRDPHIPLFLWVATAALVHLLSGGGLHKRAMVEAEFEQVRDFAHAVHAHVQQRLAPPIEVTLLSDDEPELPTPKEEPDPSAPDESSQHDTKVETLEPKPQDKPDPKLEKPEEAKPEPEKDKEQEKQEEKDIQIIPRPVKNRVAVKQHVKDKNQSNPDAQFIADEANKVKEESQARITSTDQDDPSPNPGTRVGPASEAPGDSDQNELAQSEEKAGSDPDKPLPAQSSKEVQESAANLAIKTQKAQSAEKAQAGRRAQEAAAETPETLRAERGAFPLGPATRAEEQRMAQQRKRERRAERATDFLGLGKSGTTESGVNLNLSPMTALAAIGEKQLREDVEKDAEKRRSQHRGTFQTAGLERWRSAIENYVPRVKLGNTTALNTAAVPFASYLNTIHNRLHPVFAIRFLGSLDRLPRDHVMNGKDLSTNLEIVLDRESGKLVRMGVTKTSGVTAFDIAALEAVQKASPFGPPPTEIVSPDGRVYLHWEFYRDPFYACSTYFARPFMLKPQPTSPPPKVDEPPLNPPFEEKARPGPGQRHGRLMILPRAKRDLLAGL